MNIELVPLSYKIHLYPNGSHNVDGFALKSDLPVRMCIHEKTFGGWVCDHYDTGCSFGPEFATMNDAAIFAEARMRVAIDNGELEPAIEKFYQRISGEQA